MHIIDSPKFEPPAQARCNVNHACLHLHVLGDYREVACPLTPVASLMRSRACPALGPAFYSHNERRCRI